jgi:oligopeptidase B
MGRLSVLTSCLVVLPIVGTYVSRLDAQDLKPPVATVKPKIDTLHGDIRTDNYFWIREKTNPDVIAYLNAENAYTTARMKQTETMQQKIYDEMLGRITKTDVSVPYRENGYLYWNATEKGKPHFLCH